MSWHRPRFQAGDDHEVGDCWGGLLVQNSGVATLRRGLSRIYAPRLQERHVAPIPGAELLRKAHRAFDMDRLLRDALFEKLRELPGKLANAARAVAASRERRVVDTKGSLPGSSAHGPIASPAPSELEQALEAEPALRGTAFGVSQAVTRAAQSQKPEERFRLEVAAVLTSRKRRARAHKVTASSDGPWDKSNRTFA